jgi:UrcA family protein
MILVLPLLLPGACAASAVPVQPVARVVYRDLVLDSPAGRAELRARVTAEAKAYCREHEAQVTPQLLRHDRQYCLVALRDSIARDMPMTVRRAYARARREAGARGRQL